MDFETNFGFDMPGTEETAHYTVTPEGTTANDSFWGNAFDTSVLEEALEGPKEGTYTLTLRGEDERANRFEGFPEIQFYGKLDDEPVRLTVTAQKIERKDQDGKPNGIRYEYVLFKKCLALFAELKDRVPTGVEDFKKFMTSTALSYRIVRERNGRGFKVMDVKAAA